MNKQKPCESTVIYQKSIHPEDDENNVQLQQQQIPQASGQTLDSFQEQNTDMNSYTTYHQPSTSGVQSNIQAPTNLLRPSTPVQSQSIQELIYLRSVKRRQWLETTLTNSNEYRLDSVIEYSTISPLSSNNGYGNHAFMINPIDNINQPHHQANDTRLLNPK